MKDPQGACVPLLCHRSPSRTPHPRPNVKVNQFEMHGTWKEAELTTPGRFNHLTDTSAEHGTPSGDTDGE